MTSSKPEPLTRHIWMLDGRSLCDRRAPIATKLEDLTEAEFEEWVAAQDTAPACGSCLLLVSRIRRQASALLVESAGRVWPERPSDAWELLSDTRWATTVDLAAFLADRNQIDSGSRFDALNDQVDPASVHGLVTESRERVQRLRAELADLRAHKNDGVDVQ